MKDARELTKEEAYDLLRLITIYCYKNQKLKEDFLK